MTKTMDRAEFEQMVEISFYVGAFGVQSAKTGEQARVRIDFFAYKFVYRAYLLGRSCHRMNQIMNHAVLFTVANQPFGCSVERHAQFVEILYSVNGAGGNVCRINMAMCVYCFLHFIDYQLNYFNRQ